MRLRPVRAAVTALASAGLLAASVVTSASAAAPTSAAGGAAPAASTGAKATYSPPYWFPLGGAQAAMDCAWSNPGCSNGHTDKAITWLTHDTAGIYHNVAVRAAGYGIVHVGHYGMPQCDPTPGQPLGNWVWVDHGGGVISRYSHLYKIKIQNGQQVTPNTVLAYSGSSGESASQCHIKYLNYQVEHGATGGRANGKGFEFKYSYTCADTRRISYPTALFGGRYPTWNQFPKSTFVHGQGWTHMIPRSQVTCRPT